MDRSAHAFDDELARLDAVATAEAIATRQLRADEVIAAAVERARRLEPDIRAVATEDFDRAIATAGVAPTVPGPFGGVPTFIKDMTDVAGLPTRNGSEAFDTAPPASKTAGIAEQLFAMGAIGLGKSRLPEFGFIPSTEFPHAEPTRNPWNLDHTAGGSSGGAAALVAAGVVPIAHGQDGGGSIRVPAGSCGLVGLKPTRGRLLPDPHSRLLPVDLVVDGVLTRSVRDTARYLTEADARHRNPKLLPIGDVSSPLDRPLRIGVVTESPSGAPIDEATRRELDRAVTLVESLGHRVEPLALPVSPQFPEDFVHYWSMLAWSVEVGGAQLFGSSFDRSRLSDLTRGLADRFRSHRSQTPGAIVRLRRSTAEHLAVFRSLDVIMSPTVSHLSPPIGHLGMDLPFDELFPRVEQWIGFTPLANATGAPSISLPLGHDAATNLPVGIMFGAANGHDGLLLQLALQLESADPWPHLS